MEDSPNVVQDTVTSGAGRDLSEHRIGDLRFGGASERRRQREGEEPVQCRAHPSDTINNTAGYSAPLDRQRPLLVTGNGPLSTRAPAAGAAGLANHQGMKLDTKTMMNPKPTTNPAIMMK